MCIYIFIASLNYESWLQCFFKVKKELTHFQILNFRIYNGTFLSFFQQQANNCSHFLFPHYRLQLHDIISNSSYLHYTLQTHRNNYDLISKGIRKIK